MKAARPLRLILTLFAFALFGCDHATKLAAEQGLAGKGAVSVVPRVVDLRLTHNDDVAFSMIGRFDLSTHPWILVGLATVAVAFVGALWWRQRRTASRLQHFAFAAIVAGALGNVVDRAVRGYVVDFIHVHAWPVFNVADVAVVVGGLLLAWTSLRADREAAPPRDRPA